MEWLVIVSGLVVLVLSAPVPQSQTTEEDNILLAKEFMTKFGYIDTDNLALVSVELAIKDVQKFGGIPQTGKLDNSTVQLMKSQRCGIPDRIPARSKRTKRYVLGPTRGWDKRQLTYFVANWSPKIGKNEMRSELKKALDAWAQYGGLKFQEIASPDADLVVSFGSGYHGDSYPFDGPGSVLAHAFFPEDGGSLAGDIHFDDDEPWKISPGEFEEGVDFFAVAVHEIGHSLGLSHSYEDKSIMNPYYKRHSTDSFSLGYDDILAMYELYISKPPKVGDNPNEDEENKKTTTTTRRPPPPTTTTTRPTTTTTTQLPNVTYVGDDETVEVHKTHDHTHKIPHPVDPLTPSPPASTPSSSGVPNACEGGFDAVGLLRGELFIFKDNYMWRLSRPGNVMSGYPVLIHRMFHKLPESLQRIDAVYERDTDSNIIFFSGDRYWVYNGNVLVNSSPRPLSDYGLPSYVKKVDAVMVWDRNKKTYIFSGDRYWRFNEDTHTMDSGYPKSIERFRGVPKDLDSAMTWSDGITYFFKNNLYWAFNNTWLRTEPFYPQQASEYWLGCTS